MITPIASAASTHLQTMPETNMRSTDRILKLEVIDGTKAKRSTGIVDPNLFTGKQDIHLKMDPETNLWSFQYSNQGLLPPPLKGQFTTFSKGYDHAARYFEKRNIRIVEVKD
jgi:hypothetical protein